MSSFQPSSWVMESAQGDRRVLVSYLTLRRVVGVLGVLLPVMLAVGTLAVSPRHGLRPSISDYYESPMRDVFVGGLFVIGLFLFSYRGYDRRDDVAGDLACLFALGVALFPTTSASAWIRVVHLVSATALFSTLAYFSLFLFTKGKAGMPPTAEKLVRNRVYRICGLTMLGAIVVIAVYTASGSPPSLARLNPVFWLESIALWAFGWSWFVKGKTLWRDPVGTAPR